MRTVSRNTNIPRAQPARIHHGLHEPPDDRQSQGHTHHGPPEVQVFERSSNGANTVNSELYFSGPSTNARTSRHGPQVLAIYSLAEGPAA